MIRPATQSDFPRIQELHSQMDQGYKLPQLDSPLLFTRMVLEDESGKVVACGLLRLTAETFYLFDRDADPKVLWQRVEQIQQAMERDAYSKGLDDVHLWAPPEVPEGFLRKLKRRLGWCSEPWRCLSKNLEARNV